MMHRLCFESGPDFGIIQLFMSRLRPVFLRATGHKVGIPTDGSFNVLGYPRIPQVQTNQSQSRSAIPNQSTCEMFADCTYYVYNIYICVKIILCYIVLYYIILCYITLYHVILYCVKSCYTILCYYITMYIYIVYLHPCHIPLYLVQFLSFEGGFTC